MTRLYWVEVLTQSVWNVCIKFDTWKEYLKMSILEEAMLRENHVNREIEILELTI